MIYKLKPKFVDAIQIRANNFDRICDFLGFTPEFINNPLMCVDEWGDSADPYVGLKIPYYADRLDDGYAECNIGDVIYRLEGSKKIMFDNPHRFAEKYVRCEGEEFKYCATSPIDSTLSKIED